MKSLTIALKDLSRAFRSMFALAFMFGVPILMTLLFAFLFGGVGGSDSEFTVPQTTVQLVNQDVGSDLIPAFDFEGQTTDTLGEALTRILQGNAFTELMQVTLADEAAARAAVDAREAGLAIIIPPGFTEALTGILSRPGAFPWPADHPVDRDGCGGWLLFGRDFDGRHPAEPQPAGHYALCESASPTDPIPDAKRPGDLFSFNWRPDGPAPK
jgi:hypothetical protein